MGTTALSKTTTSTGQQQQLQQQPPHQQQQHMQQAPVPSLRTKKAPTAAKEPAAPARLPPKTKVRQKDHKNQNRDSDDDDDDDVADGHDAGRLRSKSMIRLDFFFHPLLELPSLVRVILIRGKLVRSRIVEFAHCRF